MKKLFVLIVVLSLSLLAGHTFAADTLVNTWTAQSGTSTSDGAADVAVDSAGNSYVAGFTWGTLDGQTNYGLSDMILIKYNHSGNLVWQRQLGSDGTDEGYSVAVDVNDNIYVTGGSVGSFDGQVNNGFSDIFLVKYLPDGTKVWSREVGSPGTDIGWGVATDSSGNIYVTGETNDNFDVFTSSGVKDIVLVKYDTDGNKLWSYQWGTTSDDIGNNVFVNNNSIYVTGETFGDLDGNLNAGGSDIFLAKFNSSGNQVWTAQTGTDSDDYGQGLASDSSGNIYLTGYTLGGLNGNVNPGPLASSDAVLLKFTPSGALSWTKQFGTVDDDRGQDVALDSQDNIYLAGYTMGSLTGYTNAGDEDIFLSKFDSSGSQLWTRQMGTSLNDLSGGLSMANDGSFYLAGRTEGGIGGNSNIGNWDVYNMAWQIPALVIVPPLDKTFAYPNPVKNSTVNFHIYSDYTDPEFKIKIYNLAGEQVATINGASVDKSHKPVYYVTNWALKNDNGEKLASGVYVGWIVITDNESGAETTRSIKFAIIK
jgi:hypothetical protein